MIVKPSVSYASLSISDKSVVKTREDAIKQCKAVMQNTSDGVFLEQFLPGREFTGKKEAYLKLSFSLMSYSTSSLFFRSFMRW